ncbi:MAG: hypothetical protein ACYTG7_08490 [Planctomycetota bacterium]
MYRGRKVFYRKPALNYAQSWAFVHFLRHSTKENSALFKKLFEAVSKNVSAARAVEETFADVDMNQLQRDFFAYVRKLR